MSSQARQIKQLGSNESVYTCSRSVDVIIALISSWGIIGGIEYTIDYYGVYIVELPGQSVEITA